MYQIGARYRVHCEIERGRQLVVETRTAGNRLILDRPVEHRLACDDDDLVAAASDRRINVLPCLTAARTDDVDHRTCLRTLTSVSDAAADNKQQIRNEQTNKISKCHVLI